MDLRMRLASVFVSIVSFILLLGHKNLGIAFEDAHYYTLLVCGVISIALLIVDVLLRQTENKIVTTLDTFYHTLAAIAIFFTSILYLVSVFQTWNKKELSFVVARRLMAGILSVMYAVLMSSLGWILWKS